MSDPELELQLQAHPFLVDLPVRFINRLATLTTQVAFKKDDFIVRYHQPAHEFFLLTEGRVVLMNHLPAQGAVPFETVAAPGVVGWSWLLPTHQWSFDARAQTAIKGLRINATALTQLMNSDAHFACDLYRRFIPVIVDRLHNMQLQMLDIYAKPTQVSP